MNLAFLLHIYQPPIQEDKVVKDIAQSCYFPLFKLIKNKPNLRLTFNIPLSLSYLLHKTSNEEVVNIIKSLYESEKIELTSSGAYHPILTKLPEAIVEKEIILNEYGLGYYYGKNKGFEGEDAIIMKNIIGFFPPELAVNQGLVKQLDSLGYKWVAVDENAIPEDARINTSTPVFALDGVDIKVVMRNKELSNVLSFKRDTNINYLIERILFLRQNNVDIVIAMDGEFFGHHFKEGIYLFETLVERLTQLEINLVTVSQLVEDAEEYKIDQVIESSWGASHEQMSLGQLYPLWDVGTNNLQKALWDLVFHISSYSLKHDKINLPKDINVEIETYPIWDFSALDKLNNVNLKNELFKSVLLLQTMNSDQFWWASRVNVGGKEMYDTTFISNSLRLIHQYALMTQNPDLISYVDKQVSDIMGMLN